MSHITRTTLLIIAFLSFLVLAPILVLHALGINPGPLMTGNFQLENTGGIYVTSTPSATVRARRYNTQINKNSSKTYTESTGRALTGLPAGRYQVTVTSSGYRKWQKNLMVRPGLVTTHPRVRLIPKTLTRQKNTLAENVTNFSQLNKRRSPKLQFDKSSLSIIKKDVQGNTEQTISLDNILTSTPSSIALQQTSSGIYLLADGTLFHLNSPTLAGSLQAQRVAQNVNGFMAHNKAVLYWQSNQLWSTRVNSHKNGTQKNLIAHTSRPIKKARWYKAGTSHVIYQVGTAVIFTENLPQGRSWQTSLALTDPGTRFYYSPDKNTLYFSKNQKSRALNLNN